MAEFVPLNTAEENSEASWYTAMGAGIASGLIKVPEGVVSLAAELIDLGADTDLAADVEMFFDKINPFEEVAEESEKEVERLSDLILKNGVCPVCGELSQIGYNSGHYWHYCKNGHTHAVDEKRMRRI